MAALLTGSLISLCSAFAAPSPVSPVPPHIINHQAGKIIGLAVESLDGEKLGRIRNLVVALPSGEVKYVIVASGGMLGLKAELKIVSAPAISLATAKRRTASLDLSKRHWKDAPQFSKKGLAELADPQKVRNIASYYHLNATRSPKTTKQSNSATETLGRIATDQFNVRSELRLATEIIGRRVTGAGQERIGDITDLLVDLQGIKPTFAIISARRQTRKDYTFAVAFKSLRMDSPNRSVANANSGVLDQAPPFTDSVWAAPQLDVIYRYHLLGADNTARNARDRQDDSLTASSQSESEHDLKITTRLRQAVMRDKGLTLTAKNVKIITINGRVTLRGPVRNAGEKIAIKRKAEQIAGKGNVDDQLEVE